MAAKVSILMSVYNPNWDYLKETLDSIADQTFKDYELVIVDDGADDTKLSKILENYNFEKKVVKNPVNLGLPRSLNVGLKICSGEYIARIDDDDIMLPQRLNDQCECLDRNSEIVAVFSNYIIINSEGEEIGGYFGNHNKSINRRIIYKGNCLCHSTLFARKRTLDCLNGYDEKMLYSQDYDLYLRMVKIGKLYEIPKPLIKFRHSPNRISRDKRILSILFSYYASIKNSMNFNHLCFWSRTFVVLKQLCTISFEKKH